MPEPGTPDAAVLRNRQQAEGLLGHDAGRAAALRALPDEGLMVAIMSRDEAAFAVLYDRYADLVYSASLRVLADPQLAEDVSQDVFVRVWRRPEAFVPDRGRFITWLLSVTRNRAVDELRARGRRHRREGGPMGDPDEAAEPLFHSTPPDPQTSAERREQQAALRNALSALPAEQRSALELAYLGGLTQQEVAARLDAPLGTVKTRIRLGMHKLRGALDALRPGD